VATDIPAGQLPSLIEAAGDHPVRVATVGFTPPTYNIGWSSGYPIPDVAKIQRTVHRLTRQTATTTPTTSAQPESDALGSAPSTTPAPATGGNAASGRRKPACAITG
jgi:hypothetical protein